MDLTAIQRGLDAAITAANSVRGTTSPNPAVGAAILDREGAIVGVGATEPVGGAHAEIVALRQAGAQARGGMAIVTLEPCNHTGRTGPCSQALVDAGIADVRYVNPDPNPVAGGGADYLRAHGVIVGTLVARTEALEPWLAAVRMGRPHVTLKFAQSMDGFTAAVDGTSQWITGSAARRNVHEDRQYRDAIIVGTGTALADNPSLTARDSRGQRYARQPRRVVIGTRDLTGAVPNLEQLGFEQYPTIDAALTSLWDSGSRDVLVEGGAHLAGSFLAVQRVDAIRAYLAPLLLGDGAGVVAGQVAPTLSQGQRFEHVATTTLGADVLIELRRPA